MKNFTLSFLSLAVVSLILSSCSTSSDLTNNSFLKKRRYTKGYQVNIKGPNTGQKKSEATAEMQPVRAKPVNTIEQSDKNAQASLSTGITDADLAPAPKTPTAENWTKDTRRTDGNTTTSTTKNKAKTGKPRTAQFQSHSTVSGTPTPAPSEGGSLVLYIILAILIPPLAVGLLYGIGGEFWISLLLTLLFYFPGLIYALIKVSQKF